MQGHSQKNIAKQQKTTEKDSKSHAWMCIEQGATFVTPVWYIYIFIRQKGSRNKWKGEKIMMSGLYTVHDVCAGDVSSQNRSNTFIVYSIMVFRELR